MKLKLVFKPRSLDDGILLYNAQQQDNNKDFVAIILKESYIEFRFSTGTSKCRNTHSLYVNWLQELYQ